MGMAQKFFRPFYRDAVIVLRRYSTIDFYGDFKVGSFDF